MIRQVKNLLGKWFPSLASNYHSYKHLIDNQDSYIYQTGWVRSLGSGRPVDQRGNPVPWMNFTIIQILREKLNKQIAMFEFGSGYSTLFFAPRVASVVSIEYDRRWFETLKPQVPDNVDLVFQAPDINGAYCRRVNSSGERYDLILIDGRDRVNCMSQSLDCLSASGVILLDDSHRNRYAPAIEQAYSAGFRSLHVSGLKPTGTSIDRTTVFYRDNNCLGI